MGHGLVHQQIHSAVPGCTEFVGKTSVIVQKDVVTAGDYHGWWKINQISAHRAYVGIFPLFGVRHVIAANVPTESSVIDEAVGPYLFEGFIRLKNEIRQRTQ